MTRPAALLLACIILVLVGCTGERVPGLTVVDSAGVRITLGRDLPLTFRTVEPEPVLSIGGPDATGPYQFFQIDRVRADRQGRLWVADGQSGEVRIFSSDGSHWKTRGGRGDGPAEFQRIRLLGSFRGDSVALGDRGIGRVTIFDPEGEFVRTAQLSSDAGALPLPHRVFEDGSVLGQVPRVFNASSMQSHTVVADTARFVRAELQGTLNPLAEVSGPLWLWTGQSLLPIPFTANPGFDVIGEALHVVSGTAFRIRVFENGELTETYGVDRPERAVRDDDIRGYRAMTEENTDERRRPEYLAVLDHEARPEVLPAYTRLVADDDGNVWAQWHSPATTWDVFNPSREYLGQVAVPSGFVIDDIVRGSIVGVWRDELAVEHVRVYALRPE